MFLGRRPVMENDSDHAEKRTRSFRLSIFAGWLALVLALYVLSWGPAFMMYDRGMLRSPSAQKIARIVYGPLGAAYNTALLHRPLGMYLHLWSKHFDEIGNIRP